MSSGGARPSLGASPGMTQSRVDNCFSATKPDIFHQNIKVNEQVIPAIFGAMVMSKSQPQKG